MASVLPPSVSVRASHTGAHVRRRAPDLKREQIGRSAAELFVERGYAGSTTAEIAARAGVSEGIVFHHYGSKRELFRAVVAGYGHTLTRAMFGEDPRGRPVAADQAIRAGFDFVRNHAALHALFATREPELAELVYAGTHDPIVQALELALQAAVDRGTARPMDTRIVSELCYSLVDGALRACFIEGDGEREEEYLREAIHCVESALAPETRRVPDQGEKGALQ